MRTPPRRAPLLLVAGLAAFTACSDGKPPKDDDTDLPRETGTDSDSTVDSSSDTSTLSDADEDGFSEDVDCDDADASVFPGADDPCADGIDQDCDGADAACEARYVEDADAILVAQDGWLIGGSGAIVGDRFATYGSGSGAAAVLVSDAVPVGEGQLSPRLETSSATYVGVARATDDAVVLGGTPAMWIDLLAETRDEARFWYSNAFEGRGEYPLAGQLVEGDAPDAAFSAAEGLVVIAGEREGEITVPDALISDSEPYPRELSVRYTVALGDSNGDGFDELGLVGRHFSMAYVFEGPLSGTLSLAEADMTREEDDVLYLAAVGDLDGDGAAELGMCESEGGFKILSVSAGLPEVASFSDGWTGIGVGDVDADGRDDVLAYAGGIPYLVRGPVWGVQEASAGQPFPSAEGTDRIGNHHASGDLDGDGRSDFALGDFTFETGVGPAWVLFYGDGL